MARGKGGSGRRYVRDNRGRFASKGAGATARGGRLKTASGNKRATQTMKVAGSGSKIRKPMSGGSNKPVQQVSSKRQSAADRLKIKTATRRKLKTDRASVIPAKSAGPKTMKASRVSSTVAKPRTKGNSPQQVASRVKRKNAANEAGLKQMTRYGNLPNPSTYNRAIKRANTLKRADAYLKTGKLPGRDNSIRAQRQVKEATARINAKRAARQRGDVKTNRKPARAQTTPQQRRLARAEANIQRLKNQPMKPGQRRLTSQQVRRQLRADTAKDIYTATPSKARQIIRNQARLARTPRAQNNQLTTRADRLSQAKGAGLSMVKVTKPKTAKRKPRRSR